MQFYLTDAGRQAIVDQQSLGFKIELKKVVLGTAQYDASQEAPSMKAIKSQVEEKALAGGIAVEAIGELRLIAMISPSETVEIYEVGLVTSEGVLFAVASQKDAPIIRLAPNVTSTLTMGVTVSNVENSSITVSIDKESPMALALMAQHISAADPHPQYTAKIKGLEARVYDLENAIHEDISVGQLLLVDLEFTTSEQVRAYKGYGNWVKHSNGDALVSQGDSSRPEFMRTIGNTGGEDEHTLTVDEIPPYSPNIPVGTNLTGNGAINFNYAQKEKTQKYIDSVGGGKSHNNIQRSKIVGVWKRLPDSDSIYNLTTTKSEVSEGDKFTLNLSTENVAQGQQLQFLVTGLDQADITPLSGLLVVDEKGNATQEFTVNSLNSQPTVADITITLTKSQESIKVKKNMPASVITAIHITKDLITQVRTEPDIYVSHSINLYDLFVATQNRAPITNEQAYFTVHSDVAVVGTKATVPAITVGNGWLSTNILTIDNYGFILGRGGNSAKYKVNGDIGNQDGGTAIYNNSGLTVNVLNHNWISGGGGSGGYGNGASSGAGAPYGVADSTAINAKNASATFKAGGSRYTSSATGFYNGAGGTWGVNGEDGTADGLSSNKERAIGKVAGVAFSGAINLVENSGTIKGSDQT